MPVYRRLVSDSLTPVSAFHKIDAGGCACLFESVIGGEKVGRYSFLATDPFMEIEAYGNRVTRVRQRRLGRRCNAAIRSTRWRSCGVSSVTSGGHLPELPPFCSGAIGYAGYDVVRYSSICPMPRRRSPAAGFGIRLLRPMVVFDNVTKTMSWCVAWLDRMGAGPARRDMTQAVPVDRLVERLSGPPVPATAPSTSPPEASRQARRTSRTSPEALRGGGPQVRGVHPRGRHLSGGLQPAAGVPHSRPTRSRSTARCGWSIRARSCSIVRTPSVTLVGSSPEIMVRVVDGQVTVRPLAGTRPRGETDEEDRQLAEELLADPKERAEHVMLVDLGRNDVGRVARYRTVELSDVMTIERYSHVMHITSNVTGRLAAGKRRLRRSGRLFGFIGPNGAGKSTTIRFLATLLKASRGEGIVNGHSVTQRADGRAPQRRLHARQLRRLRRHEGLGVSRFLRRGLPDSRAQRKQVIGDVLELLDLTHKRDDFVNGLSRGMKQRLCLAKTLVHDPPVLILDEPASGLDPRARVEVKALLKELRRMGKTILISSHILTELADCCTSIGIIERGQLLMHGPIEDVYRRIRRNRIMEIKFQDTWTRTVDHPQFARVPRRAGRRPPGHRRAGDRRPRGGRPAGAAGGQPGASAVSPKRNRRWRTCSCW